MRVAVIGAGISGLTAAWLLARRHAVTAFEAQGRVGGHTHTHDVDLGGRCYAVDTGFIVYNDRTYPRFRRLLAQLGVRGRPTTMGFSVTNERSGLQYCGHDLDGLFLQRRNLVRPSFWAMLRDIARFNREAPRLLALQGPGPSLGGYLADAGYSRGFVEDYLVPMAAAIWSAPAARVGSFPAKRFVEFFANHGLLSLTNRPRWYTIEGGSRRYVERMLEHLDDVRVGLPVEGVRRDARGVSVRTVDGEERFEAVVIATHSDQALAMLDDPATAEREVLGGIPYHDNDVVLHTDARLLPPDPRGWAAWNYRVPRQPGGPVTVSYSMNILQGLKTPEPLVVSLNQSECIDPARVLRRLRYAHPMFDEGTLAAQRRRAEVSGVHRTWYCGAYWGHGFHEDGVRSALDVAADFGERL